MKLWISVRFVFWFSKNWHKDYLQRVIDEFLLQCDMYNMFSLPHKEANITRLHNICITLVSPLLANLHEKNNWGKIGTGETDMIYIWHFYLGCGRQLWRLWTISWWCIHTRIVSSCLCTDVPLSKWPLLLIRIKHVQSFSNMVMLLS